MRGHHVKTLLITMIAIGALAAGCGGGESPVQSQDPVPPNTGSVLAWDPPESFSDNVAMDPYLDLDYYEVYVRQDANFTDADLPVALVDAVTAAALTGGDPNGQALETEFLLDNLRPYIAGGTIQIVSLKAVGIDGQKSRFMNPVSWDTRQTLVN